MRTFYLLLAATMLAVASPGYSQEYMDAIAKSTCSCVDAIDESGSTSERNAHLGVCMLSAVVPYRDKLKADLGFNVDNLESEGDKIGKAIALRMVTICPSTLVKMTAMVEKGKKPSGVEELTVEGTVSRVDKDAFVVFSVRDANGRTVKLYWMTPVTATLDLVNDYEGLVGRMMKATYQPIEFFDPKVSDYRQFNVLTRIW